MPSTDATCDVEPFRPGILNDFPYVLPLPSKNAGFLGSVICFEDGSCWKITKALSSTAYQQGQPPFEARQVFTCVCLKDPQHNYDGIKEAVMKVKYQITGTEKSIYFYQKNLKTCREIAINGNYPFSLKRSIQDLNQAFELVQMATQPVEWPNEATMQELKALTHFHREGCDSTPHLLDFVGDFIEEGVDEQEMVDGYAVFILMAKVPGERLDYHKYWNRSETQRDEIRAAFKEALLEVYNRRIYPYDTALRNIMWDEEARKCYIVGFEDYSIADPEGEPIKFKGHEYRC